MFGGNKPFGTATSFTGSSFSAPGTGFGQNTTAFGSRPATGMFGGGFGSTAPAANTSIFSTNTAPTGTGLFGQTTGFGTPASSSTNTFGGFGVTTTSSSLFGGTSQPITSTSLFGANTSSAFGTPRPAFGSFTSTSTPSLFGQPQQTAGGLFTQTPGVATGGGLFSTPGFPNTQTGTTIKFNPPTGTDTMIKNGVSTNISTRHQCITCMKEYENKSLEELRMEDYSASRKGPQQTSTGLFGGTPASTSFSFGTTQNKPLFGATATTPGFGATAGTGLFGQSAQPQQQSAGLFSKPLAFGTPTATTTANSFSFGTNIFGNNTQQKPLFGQMSGGNLFGSTTTPQQQPTSLFGTTPVFGSTFGTTTQNTGGLLGNKPSVFGATTAPGTSSAFSFNTGTNTGTTTNFFGNKTTGTATTFPATTPFSAFNSTPSTGISLFGQNKPATGFGTTPAFGTGLGTGFGLGGFGSNLTTNTGTSLFNTTSTANKPSTFGGFGTGFGNSIFSNPTNPTGTLTFGNTAASTLGGDPAAANLANQVQAQNQILALTSNPFGYSPLFNNPVKNTNRREEVLKPTNPAAQKSLLNNFKVPAQPTGKIKPMPLQTVANGKVSLFNGLEEEAANLASETFVPRKSVKKLTVKPKVSPDKPLENNNNSLLSPATGPFTDIEQRNGEHHPGSLLSKISPVRANSSDAASPSDNYHLNKPLQGLNSSNGLTALENTISELQPRQTGLFRAIHSPAKETEDDLDEEDVGQGGEESQPESSTGPESNGETADEAACNRCGVILKRSGYYTLPPLEKLDKLVDQDGNCFVENFAVGRENYGNVYFPGVTNVAGINLDEIVHFRRKEVTVYVDDEKKPPIGEGLNKKAQVTLDCVWPPDRTTHNPITSPERLRAMNYETVLEKASSKIGAKFIEYRPETGSWVFQVQHF